MYKIVLLCHGESVWDREHRLTGWTDVDLTTSGIEAAREAGRLLRREGHAFELAYSSVLRHANQTLNGVLETLDALWLPVEHSWRLNARHLGALQGLREDEAAAAHGEDQLAAWRRSYDSAPPCLPEGDARLNSGDPRYSALPRARFPRTECLKDTVARVVPYWETVIVPQILSGKRVLVVAHGDSLRALIKHLDGIPEADIAGMALPAAQPLVYELDANLRPIRGFVLADRSDIRGARGAIAAPDRT